MLSPAARVGGLVVRRPLIVAAGLTALGAVLGWAAAPGEPLDYSYFALVGERILHGQLSRAYAEPGNQAGPWQLVSAGLLRALLPGRLDILVLHVVGGALAVAGGMLVLTRRRRLLQRRPAPLLVLAVGMAIAVWEVPGYVFEGHAAEVAVPIMWLAAAGAVRCGRINTGAALIGLSCGWELWGILGVPLLLLHRAGWRPRLMQLVLMGLAAGLPYLPFALSGRFELLHYRWPIGVGTLLHLVGARGSFSWEMRVLQAAACVAGGTALALRSRDSVHSVWLVPLLVAEVRLLLDPQTYDYYWVVPQLLVLYGVGLLDREPVRAKVLVGLLAYAQMIALPHTRIPLLVLSVALCLVLSLRLTRPGWVSASEAVPAAR